MGAILATTMFANVWFVIWPNQQIIIGSARKVAEGVRPIRGQRPPRRPPVPPEPTR